MSTKVSQHETKAVTQIKHMKIVISQTTNSSGVEMPERDIILFCYPSCV